MIPPYLLFIRYLAEELRVARRLNKLSQTALAAIMGSHRSTLRNLEAGRLEGVQLKTVLLYCQYLGISPSYVFSRAEERCNENVGRASVNGYIAP